MDGCRWAAAVAVVLATAVAGGPVQHAAATAPVTAPVTTPGTTPASVVGTSLPPGDDEPGELVPDDLPGDPRSALSTADGQWNLQAVLAVLATKVSLDGVTPDPVLAGLMADEELAEALLAVSDQLTDQQRSIAMAFVFPGPAERVETMSLTVTDADIAAEAATSATSPTSPTGGTDPADVPTFATAPSSPVPSSPAPSSPVQNGFVRRPDARRTLSDDAAGYLRTYFRRSGRPVEDLVIVVEHGPTAGGVLATALPLTDGRNGCLIRISTTNVSGSLQHALAHEAYHCFQFAVRIPLGLHPWNEPRWVMEGTPSWASAQVQPDASWANSWYQTWVGSVSPLTTRDYAALGFYDTIAESSAIDMWRLMVELLSTNDPATVLKNRLSPTTLGHWGAQYFDDGALGQLFFFPPYDAPAALVLRGAISLGGVPKIFTVPPMSSRAISVTGLGGDGVFVLRSTAVGIAKVGTDTFSFDANHPGFMCYSDASCLPCPAGGPVIHRVSGDSAAIGAASYTGGNVRVSLVTRESVCAPTIPVSPGGANCIVGQWSSTEMLLPPVPDQISSIGGAGTLLDFGADGQLLIDFNGMQPVLVQFKGIDHGEIITAGTRFSGSSQTTYAVTGGNLDAGTLDQNAVRVIATVEIDNVGQGPNVPEREVMNMTLAELQAMAGAAGVSPEFGQSQITCTATSLTMTRTTPTGQYTWVFERVGSTGG